MPYKVNLNIKNSMHPFNTIYFQYPPQFWIAVRIILLPEKTSTFSEKDLRKEMIYRI